MQDREVRFLDPSRHQCEQCTIVLLGDHKLCPKSVKICQQCRMKFTDMNDKYVIKAVDCALKNKGPDTGKLKKSVEKT